MKEIKSLNNKRAQHTTEDVDASQSLSPIEVRGDKDKKLIFYSDEDMTSEVSSPDTLLQPLDVYSPNANGGDYKKAFVAMGASNILAHDTMSSAGDWGFIVKRGGIWYWGNQYMSMQGGFTYTLNETDAREICLSDPDFGDEVCEAIRQVEPDFDFDEFSDNEEE